MRRVAFNLAVSASRRSLRFLVALARCREPELAVRRPRPGAGGAPAAPSSGPAATLPPATDPEPTPPTTDPAPTTTRPEPTSTAIGCPPNGEVWFEGGTGLRALRRVP